MASSSCVASVMMDEDNRRSNRSQAHARHELPLDVALKAGHRRAARLATGHQLPLDRREGDRAVALGLDALSIFSIMKIVQIDP